jgi:ABC-2 type transport system permease protein
MDSNHTYIAFQTIVRKEVTRFMRIWTQTLLPSVITSTLYFAIFGAFLGTRIGLVEGVPYIAFIVPGLVMMAVITNAYSNVASSFYGAKFMKNLEEIMVAPVPHWVVIAGYVSGGALRGSITGVLSLLVALFFTKLPIAHPGVIFAFLVLTALICALAGLINGVFAKSFDSVMIFPTFVLTPLTYLGGVFYPISVLPPFWQAVSQANPILYLINGFRYGFLGTADVSIGGSFAVLGVFAVGLLVLVVYLFAKGYGLRA